MRKIPHLRPRVIRAVTRSSQPNYFQMHVFDQERLRLEAEKVLQEMEEEISERLRSLSRNYILGILPTALANAGIQAISAGAGNNGLEEKNEGNQKPAYSGLGCSGSGETAAAGVQAEAEGAGGELNDQQAGNGLIDAERTESLWYALAIISVPVDLPEITGIEDSPLPVNRSGKPWYDCLPSPPIRIRSRSFA